MNIADLHSKIAAVCPILGVAVGDQNNKATWRIDYAPSATAAQQQSAQNVVANYSATSSDKQQAAQQAVQEWLDSTAQSYSYGDIVSACSYVGSSVDLWNRQGTAFKSWRDQVWQALYALQTNVANRTATAPTTAAALIAQLPQPVIPAS